MKTVDSENRNIVVATRLKPSTFKLLDHLSSHTKIRKSMLIRAALTQWLQNAPEDLPLDLKIEITRANIQHQIDTIKNLRWTYHQCREAISHMKEMEKQEWLPPHAAHAIKKLEKQIITMKEQLDTYLKQQYQKGETP